MKYFFIFYSAFFLLCLFSSEEEKKPLDFKKKIYLTVTQNKHNTLGTVAIILAYPFLYAQWMTNKCNKSSKRLFFLSYAKKAGGILGLAYIVRTIVKGYSYYQKIPKELSLKKMSEKKNEQDQPMPSLKIEEIKKFKEIINTAKMSPDEKNINLFWLNISPLNQDIDQIINFLQYISENFNEPDNNSEETSRRNPPIGNLTEANISDDPLEPASPLGIIAFNCIEYLYYDSNSNSIDKKKTNAHKEKFLEKCPDALLEKICLQRAHFQYIYEIFSYETFSIKDLFKNKYSKKYPKRIENIITKFKIP